MTNKLSKQTSHLVQKAVVEAPQPNNFFLGGRATHWIARCEGRERKGAGNSSRMREGPKTAPPTSTVLEYIRFTKEGDVEGGGGLFHVC